MTNAKLSNVAEKDGIVTCSYRAAMVTTDDWADARKDAQLITAEVSAESNQNVTDGLLEMVERNITVDADNTEMALFEMATGDDAHTISFYVGAIIVDDYSVAVLFAGKIPGSDELLKLSEVRCSIDEDTGEFYKETCRSDEFNEWVEGLAVLPVTDRVVHLCRLDEMGEGFAVAFFALGGVEGISQQFDN